jgi:outer membrane receptor protein involved in Fe transport
VLLFLWRPRADLARTLGLVFIFVSFVLALLVGWRVPVARADEPPDGGVASTLGPDPSADAGDPAPQEVHVQGRATTQVEASEVKVGHADLAMQPRLRAEQILEAVPGLFTVQHSGGAKAQQYFLRGFDADHGTDIAFFADGMPLNAVSHAHGQGYTDLHFVIPELVLGLEGTKGPYAARYGDFATAGAVDLHFVEELPESSARVELGPWGHARGVVIASPSLGEAWRTVVAGELYSDNGEFVHPEEHHRMNGYGRVSRRLDDDSELSLTWMGYGASWNASGILPARAVCGEGDANPPPSAYGASCIGRTDSVDPSQGGQSQRMGLALSYRMRRSTIDVGATAYVVRSSLALFLDDTLFADDPIHGDEIEQDDQRTEIGVTSRVTKRARVLGMDTATSFGLQLRSDAIANGLHHDEARQRLETIASSDVEENELGMYVEEDMRPAPWIRFVLGARADRVDVAVQDAGPSAMQRVSGAQSGGLVSPKWSAVVTPAKNIDLFLNYGRGFHSNDARGVVGGGATLLAVATGYEAGVRIAPLKGLSLSAAAYLLDLTSELVFDGDTGSTQPAGATRREGLELVARYRVNQAVFADAALTFNRARFREDDGSGTLVPLAPTRTFVAGVGVREPVGPITAFGSVRVKSMADRPATQDGRLVAEGFTLLDAQAGARWKQLELAVDALNALDTSWREGQLAVTSRMQYEPAPKTAVSYTPGWPREVLGRATLYW